MIAVQIPALTLASYDHVKCYDQEAWVDRAWKIQTKAALKEVCPKTNEKLTYSLKMDCFLKKIWANKEYHFHVQDWKVHQVILEKEEYDKYSKNSSYLMGRLKPSTWRWKWAYAYWENRLCESAEMDRGANAYYACATYVLDYREDHYGFQYRFGCVFDKKEPEE
ncbi:unnamed protein product [Cylicocyclus nassatus]|uniref:Uncharacterized protein n=1 Tax=Cylicocyclus nassatus TaxID=53992 RepID=A0AA36DQG5_CYLNA|nr:unnamed protein product [Cylicocyclus nassatus]